MKTSTLIILSIAALTTVSAFVSATQCSLSSQNARDLVRIPQDAVPSSSSCTSYLLSGPGTVARVVIDGTLLTNPATSSVAINDVTFTTNATMPSSSTSNADRFARSSIYVESGFSGSLTVTNCRYTQLTDNELPWYLPHYVAAPKFKGTRITVTGNTFIASGPSLPTLFYQETGTFIQSYCFIEVAPSATTAVQVIFSSNTVSITYTQFNVNVILQLDMSKNWGHNAEWQLNMRDQHLRVLDIAADNSDAGGGAAATASLALTVEKNIVNITLQQLRVKPQFEWYLTVPMNPYFGVVAFNVFALDRQVTTATILDNTVTFPRFHNISYIQLAAVNITSWSSSSSTVSTRRNIGTLDVHRNALRFPSPTMVWQVSCNLVILQCLAFRQTFSPFFRLGDITVADNSVALTNVKCGVSFSGASICHGSVVTFLGMVEVGVPEDLMNNTMTGTVDYRVQGQFAIRGNTATAQIIDDRIAASEHKSYAEQFRPAKGEANFIIFANNAGCIVYEQDLLIADNTVNDLVLINDKPAFLIAVIWAQFRFSNMRAPPGLPRMVIERAVRIVGNTVHVKEVVGRDVRVMGFMIQSGEGIVARGSSSSLSSSTATALEMHNNILDFGPHVNAFAGDIRCVLFLVREKTLTQFVVIHSLSNNTMIGTCISGMFGLSYAALMQLSPTASYALIADSLSLTDNTIVMTIGAAGSLFAGGAFLPGKVLLHHSLVVSGNNMSFHVVAQGADMVLDTAEKKTTTDNNGGDNPPPPPAGLPSGIAVKIHKTMSALRVYLIRCMALQVPDSSGNSNSNGNNPALFVAGVTVTSNSLTVTGTLYPTYIDGPASLDLFAFLIRTLLGVSLPVITSASVSIAGLFVKNTLDISSRGGVTVSGNAIVADFLNGVTKARQLTENDGYFGRDPAVTAGHMICDLSNRSSVSRLSLNNNYLSVRVRADPDGGSRAAPLNGRYIRAVVGSFFPISSSPAAFAAGNDRLLVSVTTTEAEMRGNRVEIGASGGTGLLFSLCREFPIVDPDPDFADRMSEGLGDIPPLYLAQQFGKLLGNGIPWLCIDDPDTQTDGGATPFSVDNMEFAAPQFVIRNSTVSIRNHDGSPASSSTATAQAVLLGLPRVCLSKTTQLLLQDLRPQSRFLVAAQSSSSTVITNTLVDSRLAGWALRCVDVDPLTAARSVCSDGKAGRCSIQPCGGTESESLTKEMTRTRTRFPPCDPNVKLVPQVRPYQHNARRLGTGRPIVVEFDLQSNLKRYGHTRFAASPLDWSFMNGEVASSSLVNEATGEAIDFTLLSVNRTGVFRMVAEFKLSPSSSSDFDQYKIDAAFRICIHSFALACEADGAENGVSSATEDAAASATSTTTTSQAAGGTSTTRPSSTTAATQTSAPATILATTSDAPGKNQQRFPPPICSEALLLPRRWSAVSSAGATAVSRGIAAAGATSTPAVLSSVFGRTASLSSAVALQRQQFILSFVECQRGADGGGPLDFLSSPLGLEVGSGPGRFVRGAALGNTLIIVAVLLLCVAVAVYRSQEAKSARVKRVSERRRRQQQQSSQHQLRRSGSGSNGRGNLSAAALQTANSNQQQSTRPSRRGSVGSAAASSTAFGGTSTGFSSSSSSSSSDDDDNGRRAGSNSNNRDAKKAAKYTWFAPRFQAESHFPNRLFVFCSLMLQGTALSIFSLFFSVEPVDGGDVFLGIAAAVAPAIVISYFSYVILPSHRLENVVTCRPKKHVPRFVTINLSAWQMLGRCWRVLRAEVFEWKSRTRCRDPNEDETLRRKQKEKTQQHQQQQQQQNKSSKQRNGNNMTNQNAVKKQPKTPHPLAVERLGDAFAITHPDWYYFILLHDVFLTMIFGALGSIDAPPGSGGCSALQIITALLISFSLYLALQMPLTSMLENGFLAVTSLLSVATLTLVLAATLTERESLYSAAEGITVAVTWLAVVKFVADLLIFTEEFRKRRNTQRMWLRRVLQSWCPKLLERFTKSSSTAATAERDQRRRSDRGTTSVFQFNDYNDSEYDDDNDEQRSRGSSRFLRRGSGGQESSLLDGQEMRLSDLRDDDDDDARSRNSNVSRRSRKPVDDKAAKIRAEIEKRLQQQLDFEAANRTPLPKRQPSQAVLLSSMLRQPLRSSPPVDDDDEDNQQQPRPLTRNGNNSNSSGNLVLQRRGSGGGGIVAAPKIIKRSDGKVAVVPSQLERYTLL